MKIGIIGSGAVGATIAYSIASDGLATKIVIADKVESKAEGEALDLAHCAYFIPPVKFESGGLAACRGMDAVVITAGVKRRPGEQRTDLINRNIAVCREITEPLAEANPDAIFILVSNPVDLLTLYWIKHSGVPGNRIIGSGTLLDTSRFRYLLSRYAHVDPRSIHAYIIGEHGAGSVPVWSSAQVGLLPIADYAKEAGLKYTEETRNMVFDEVLSAGKNVIERKGATYYGIAQSTLRILKAISRDEGSILTLSTDVSGYYGLEEIAMSVPVVLGREGLRQIVSPSLDESEIAGFAKAGRTLHQIAREAGIV
jgi:L-lactate dehydrogenase